MEHNLVWIFILITTSIYRTHAYVMMEKAFLNQLYMFVLWTTETVHMVAQTMIHYIIWT